MYLMIIYHISLLPRWFVEGFTESDLRADSLNEEFAGPFWAEADSTKNMLL